MLEVAAAVCWLIALIGLVMVVGALIARATKRLLRIRDEALNDPWFRRHDTAGLSLGIHWMRPGLVLMVTAGGAALLLETFS